jgi:hypothetical protein
LKYYTGVGSRKTPKGILDLMTAISVYARSKGIILRSGGALGADTAFEKGAGSLKEIFYASDATPEAAAIAREFHPAWDRCSGYARKLHARNAFQVLGRGLDSPSLCLICWTPDGCVSHTTRSQKTGGTGTAISIAEKYNVKIYNLYRPEHLALWDERVTKNTDLNNTLISK